MTGWKLYGANIIGAYILQKISFDMILTVKNGK